VLALFVNVGGKAYERHGNNAANARYPNQWWVAGSGTFYLTLVPIRPRRRGERRSLRTFSPGVSLRPPHGFNPDTPRRLSTPTDAFQLHPDVRIVRNDPQSELVRKTLEQRAEQVEQFKLEQRAAVFNTVRAQREEKHQRDASTRRSFVENSIGPEYFGYFGNSAR